MPLGGALGVQKGVHNLGCQPGPDEACPEREHVGVVVLTAVAGTGEVVTQGRANAGNLVGGHGRSDSGPVDDNAGHRLTGSHLAGDRVGDAGVVYRLRAERAAVCDLAPAGREVRRNRLLEFKAAVIGAEGDDAHGSFRSFEVAR